VGFFVQEPDTDQREQHGKGINMNSDANRLNAEFATDSGFTVPISAVPARGRTETDLECLKDRVLQRLLTETSDMRFHVPVQRAVSDAATLAWLTPYPLLLFPVLAAEKAHAAIQRVARQREIRQRSMLLAQVAA
jgi:hypothetical protein